MSRPQDPDDVSAAEVDAFGAQAASAVEAWCEWVERLALRDDGALCEACAGSSLLEALGEFSLLPHHPIHVLFQMTAELIGGEVDRHVDSRVAALRRAWERELDPDRPDGPPDLDGYAALRAWYESERLAAAAAGETLHELLAIELRDVIARVASDRVMIARALATDWLAASVDDAAARPDRLGLVPAVLLREVADTVDTRVRQWMVWLASGAWRHQDPVPCGERCEVCAAAWPVHVEAPHGAMHPLRRRLAGVLDGALAAPVVSPAGERDPMARRIELQAIIDQEVLARAGFIRQALELHVFPEIATEVIAASRYLLTTQPGDEETDADAGRGASSRRDVGRED
ncbi:MAG TPA: hypothetical protein VGM70_09145 [Pseudolysinimonas sp.]